jgi:hypothetical protein
MSIKKALFTVLIITSVQVNAQVVLGLKGGLNVATLGTSSSYQPRLSYHIGGYYSQHIEEQYGLQIELQYSLQGARVANGVSGSRLSYHYISLPLLVKFYFSGSIYAEVGPQVAYLISAKYLETGFKEDKTSSVKRWDFLGMVGFGHETDSGGNMGLRLGIGFTNPSGASVGNEFVPRNLVLQGYIAFALKELDR